MPTLEKQEPLAATATSPTLAYLVAINIKFEEACVPLQYRDGLLQALEAALKEPTGEPVRFPSEQVVKDKLGELIRNRKDKSRADLFDLFVKTMHEEWQPKLKQACIPELSKCVGWPLQSKVKEICQKEQEKLYRLFVEGVLLSEAQRKFEDYQPIGMTEESNRDTWLAALRQEVRAMAEAEPYSTSKSELVAKTRVLAVDFSQDQGRPYVGKQVRQQVATTFKNKVDAYFGNPRPFKSEQLVKQWKAELDRQVLVLLEFVPPAWLTSKVTRFLERVDKEVDKFVGKHIERSKELLQTGQETSLRAIGEKQGCSWTAAFEGLKKGCSKTLHYQELGNGQGSKPTELAQGSTQPRAALPTTGPSGRY